MPSKPGYIVNYLKKLVESREGKDPDYKVGGDNPFLYRYKMIPSNPIFNIYLHKFIRSDQNREMHCHEWSSLSYLITGLYVEHKRDSFKIYKEGSLIFRPFGGVPHRIELIDGACWTLFITGPKYRKSGFWCRNGDGGYRFVLGEEYIALRDSGVEGGGCANQSIIANSKSLISPTHESSTNRP